MVSYLFSIDNRTSHLNILIKLMVQTADTHIVFDHFVINRYKLYMRKFFLIVSMLCSWITFEISAQAVPLVVSSHLKMTEDIAKDIAKTLPRGMTIYLYPIQPMNLSASDEKIIVNVLEKMISEKFFVHGNKPATLSDITDTSIRNLMTEYPSLEDILNAANIQKYDAVLLANITQIKSETRNIWSASSRAIEKKNIYLYQGNLFKPDNQYVLMRFYKFFYIE